MRTFYIYLTIDRNVTSLARMKKQGRCYLSNTHIINFVPMPKILDIGCGDGTIWLNNQNKISNNISITLAYFSENA